MGAKIRVDKVVQGNVVMHSHGVDDLLPEIDARYVNITGDTMQGDLNFAQYKAIAMVCDNGTTFPSTPVAGQWFYRTDLKLLLIYGNSAWRSLACFTGLTLYVDGTLGTDAVGQGYASGTGATKTISYANNLIPDFINGNVTINIAAGTYTETWSVPKIGNKGYSIQYVGTYTTVVTGTITDCSSRDASAGTGTISTPAGGSTTVTIAGGGDTSRLRKYSIVTGTTSGLQALITSIIDSTSFTVSHSVDFSNGGAGESYTITDNWMEDSTKTWTDDLYNDYYLMIGSSVMPIIKTHAGYQLRPAFNTTTTMSIGAAYSIVSLATTVVTGSSGTITTSDNGQIATNTFQFINFDESASTSQKAPITASAFSSVTLKQCTISGNANGWTVTPLGQSALIISFCVIKGMLRGLNYNTNGMCSTQISGSIVRMVNLISFSSGSNYIQINRHWSEFSSAGTTLPISGSGLQGIQFQTTGKSVFYNTNATAKTSPVVSSSDINSAWNIAGTGFCYRIGFNTTSYPVAKQQADFGDAQWVNLDGKDYNGTVTPIQATSDYTANIVKQYTGQTTDLSQWQSSTGTELACVEPDGAMCATGTTKSLPAYHSVADVTTGIYFPSSGIMAITANGKRNTQQETDIQYVGEDSTTQNATPTDYEFRSSKGTGTGSGNNINFSVYSGLASSETSITYDNSFAVSKTSAASHTQALTVGVNNNRILFAQVHYRSNTTISNTVTYAGVSMTLLSRKVQSTVITSELWYLVAPATGANNVVVTPSVSAGCKIGAISYYGVSQATPLGTLSAVSASGTGLTATVTAVAPAANWLTLDFLGKDNATETPTNDASQTSRYTVGTTTGVTAWIGCSEKTSGTAMTWTWTTTGRNWALTTVALVPSANEINQTKTNALKITNDANVKIPNDSKKMFFGAGDDASMYYDGTNAIINPKEVGSGYLDILGNIHATGYSVGATAGIDKTLTVLDADGVTTHAMTFTKGILTACT